MITGTITDAEPDEDGNTVGVSGVQITVTGGGDLLNGRTVAGRTYVTTNSSGQYTAVMESGGTGTVTPTKTDYSFDPATQDVTLNADSVKGIDFTGSSYATITGTVMADGAALEGVTVTATSGGKSDSDDTDRRGRFSVSVPAGAITITATKTGYTFADRTVFADAGDTRSLGDITATGNVAPVNLAASRDTTDNANTFGANVTVTWSAGPGGHAASYQVQTWDADATPPEDWDNAGTGLTPADTTSAGTYTSSATATDGAMRIRVVATDDASVEYPSATVTVAAVNPVVSNVAVARDRENDPDSLEVSWDAKGNTNSRWRVAISFDAGTSWYEANDAASGGRWAPLLQPNDFSNMTHIAETPGDAKDATQAELDGAIMIRVDYRQGETRDDGTGTQVPNPWKTGPTASVTAKTP